MDDMKNSPLIKIDNPYSGEWVTPSKASSLKPFEKKIFFLKPPNLGLIMHGNEEYQR